MKVPYAFYNDIDPYCAAWLRNLIGAGLLPRGDVDSRSIKEIDPDELSPYTQCHFFSGIGGWPLALRLAGWKDTDEVWTGSAPCQPFSVAGRGAGVTDDRHLWPDFYRLIRACRPPVCMGEQVGLKAGYDWVNGVGSDLESEGYHFDAVDIPAASVNAPHKRNRIYWIADRVADTSRQHDDRRGARGGTEHSNGSNGVGSGLADRDESGRSGRSGVGNNPLPERPSVERGGGAGLRLGDSPQSGRQPGRFRGREAENGEVFNCESSYSSNDVENFWSDSTLLGPDRDGLYRRTQPGTPCVAPRNPTTSLILGALGNSICIPLAVEVIRAYMECRP